MPSKANSSAGDLPAWTTSLHRLVTFGDTDDDRRANTLDLWSAHSQETIADSSKQSHRRVQTEIASAAAHILWRVGNGQSTVIVPAIGSIAISASLAALAFEENSYTLLDQLPTVVLTIVVAIAVLRDRPAHGARSVSLRIVWACVGLLSLGQAGAYLVLLDVPNGGLFALSSIFSGAGFLTLARRDRLTVWPSWSLVGIGIVIAAATNWVVAGDTESLMSSRLILILAGVETVVAVALFRWIRDLRTQSTPERKAEHTHSPFT